MNTQQFGKFIAEQRKAKGYTQKELAEKLGVTDKAISRWENGHGYPDIVLEWHMWQKAEQWICI